MTATIRVYAPGFFVQAIALFIALIISLSYSVFQFYKLNLSFRVLETIILRFYCETLAIVVFVHINPDFNG